MQPDPNRFRDGSQNAGCPNPIKHEKETTPSHNAGVERIILATLTNLLIKT
jgi:hypothetical protein